MRVFRLVLARVAAVSNSSGLTSLSPLRGEAPIEYHEDLGHPGEGQEATHGTVGERTDGLRWSRARIGSGASRSPCSSTWAFQPPCSTRWAWWAWVSSCGGTPCSPTPALTRCGSPSRSCPKGSFLIHRGTRRLLASHAIPIIRLVGRLHRAVSNLALS
jgi:hypothetical protein